MAKKKSKTKNSIIVIAEKSLRQRTILPTSLQKFLNSYHFVAYLSRKALLSFIKTDKRNSSKRVDKGDLTYMGYKFLGKPNEEQMHLLSQFAGACRFLWNRMLEDFNNDYKLTGKSEIHTPAYYKQQEDTAWLKDMDSLALANVQLNFESAADDFLKGKKGHPRFKKKHERFDSYTTNKINDCNNVSYDGEYLILPKIPGKIKLIAHREIEPGGKIKSVTVTHGSDDKWYFSLLYEYPLEEFSFSNGIEEFFVTGDIDAIKHTGLDMSLPKLFVSSDGILPEYINNGIVVRFEKAYKKLEKRIAKEQRKLSHMVKDSNNYTKQLKKIARLHAKAKHQRMDFLQQLSTRLVRIYDIISIEDLDMAAMKQSLKLGKSVSDNGWGMFVDMLGDKAVREGKLLIRVDKWFPSSKLCSHCGNVHKELELNDRTYICPRCGFTMDRDGQAACNIDEEGLNIFLSNFKPNIIAA